MDFDVKRVYSAVNADEVKVGSRAILADAMETLKVRVLRDVQPGIIDDIRNESSVNRFHCNSVAYNLAYIISEPEEKKLKWTDLKLGDVVRKIDGSKEALVVMIDKKDTVHHVNLGGWWKTDEQLGEWEKVEE